MTYYDLHSHLLPEMDDGSRSVEQSLRLIDKLRAQNVRRLCFTPHYYTHEESIRSFLKRRAESAEKLMPLLPEDVEVCIGAEVYITDYLFNNKDLSEICYTGGKYILVEFPFASSFEGRTLDWLSRLKNNYGLNPVLTHIERYENLMRDESLVYNLKDEGIIIQTNVGAFKGFALKRRLLKYIKHDLIDVVGTDCHSETRGAPEDYTPTIDLIRDKCGQEYVDHILETSEKVFRAVV